ncbi:hypothetical protein [Salinicoccus sp. RF5]|nr:hypothetical protein [Salinicoccus sp. RF5]MCC4721446.1 hypothetical protein [Salinicoccus sp. RF5]
MVKTAKRTDKGVFDDYRRKQERQEQMMEKAQAKQSDYTDEKSKEH